jgi:hypothetical protein
MARKHGNVKDSRRHEAIDRLTHYRKQTVSLDNM